MNSVWKPGWWCYAGRSSTSSKKWDLDQWLCLRDLVRYVIIFRQKSFGAQPAWVNLHTPARHVLEFPWISHRINRDALHGGLVDGHEARVWEVVPGYREVHQLTGCNRHILVPLKHVWAVFCVWIEIAYGRCYWADFGPQHRVQRQ
jgi:hypothetical protein